MKSRSTQRHKSGRTTTAKAVAAKKAAAKKKPVIVHASQIGRGEPIYVVCLLDEFGNEKPIGVEDSERMAAYAVLTEREDGNAAVARKIERIELADELVSENVIREELARHRAGNKKHAEECRPGLRGHCRVELANNLDGHAIAKLRMKIAARNRAYYLKAR